MSFTPRTFQEIRDAVLEDIVARGLITDKNIGGVARTLVEASARELATLQANLANVFDSAFIDKARGRSLEFVVSILGIERIKAGRALGVATFSRRTPAPGDINILKGTIVTTTPATETDQSVVYETTEERTLPKGDLEIEAPVQAQIEGNKNEVDANQITVLPRPIVGIERVTNDEPTRLRKQEETDAELRERAKNALRNSGKATQDAIAFAVRTLGVESVEVLDRPGRFGGEIEVIVDGAGLDNPTLQRQIEDVIHANKAAGIKAGLRITQRIHLPMTLKLSLKQPDLEQEEIDGMLDAAGAAIETYFDALGVGETVRKNGIISTVLANPNILDVEIAPLDDDLKERVLPNGDIFIDKQERAVLDRTSDLTLVIEERKFRIFVEIEDENLTLAGDASMPQAQILENIQAHLKSFFKEVENNLGDDIEESVLSYESFRVRLQIEGFTIEESSLRVTLLHLSDGFENVLQVPGHQDVIKANETLELRRLAPRITIIPT